MTVPILLRGLHLILFCGNGLVWLLWNRIMFAQLYARLLFIHIAKWSDSHCLWFALCACVINLALWFSIQFKAKKIQRVENSTSKNGAPIPVRSKIMWHTGHLHVANKELRGLMSLSPIQRTKKWGYSALPKGKMPWQTALNQGPLLGESKLGGTVRAPVFGRHQFFGTSEHYGKAQGSLLSGWMNYNYTACCWFPTSSNILILPSQFWQIRFESCWLHCSKCRILVLLRYFCIRYTGWAAQMGLVFEGEIPTHGSVFWGERNPYRWVLFSGFGVLTNFASILCEIIPEIIESMFPQSPNTHQQNATCICMTSVLYRS